MAFCGQCGLLLLPDAVVCPRCSTAVTSSWVAADKNADAATIISKSDKAENVENVSSSNPDRVQEVNQSLDYKTEAQKTEQSKYTPIPPTIQHASSTVYQPIASSPSDQDYLPQSSEDFSSTQRAPYPGYISPTVSGYPSAVPLRKTKKRAGLLVTFLTVLFLVGSTVMILIVGPDRIIQMVRGINLAPQTTAVPPTSQVPTSVPLTPTAQSSPTPEQQAQTVIDHYYTAINSKDYQTAYDLWLNYPESYQSFANGFADTSHDDYTFGDLLQQSEGNVQVNITIVATSTSYQQTTYQGYYVVEQQQDGSWKIISAKIHKA